MCPRRPRVDREPSSLARTRHPQVACKTTSPLQPTGDYRPRARRRNVSPRRERDRGDVVALATRRRLPSSHGGTFRLPTLGERDRGDLGESGERGCFEDCHHGKAKVNTAVTLS
ncbi:hypothetical protein BHM03_00003736 [Ensete ventricosum]|nr:hypothetical protein BHM03_00003736 [Ensete ventricosum]